MRTFDFYEFTGVFVPGAVLWLGLALFWSGDQLQIVLDSTGGAVLLLVVAYATGHVVQLAGNLLETLWWVRRAMPSDWPRSRATLISPEVRATLVERFGMTRMSRDEWKVETRRLIGAVHAAGWGTRLERFNGNYGLLRGTAASLLLTLGVGAGTGALTWASGLVLVGAALAALIRMERFARYYAEELLNRAAELSD